MVYCRRLGNGGTKPSQPKAGVSRVLHSLDKIAVMDVKRRPLCLEGIMLSHIHTYLDQIKWERYRRGAYPSVDPLLVTQDKLRRMRKGEQEELTPADVALLRQAIAHSLTKLRAYDYGEGFDVVQAEQLRQASIVPLLEADAELQGVVWSVTA